MARRKMHLGLLASGLGVVLVPVAMLAQSGQTRNQSPDRSWQPDARNRAAYKTIVDLNIFLPDRSALADELEQENDPPAQQPEREPTPTDTTPALPPNPDSNLVIRGTSLRGSVGYVFIEDLGTSTTTRLQVPCDFAQGQLSDVTLDGVTYTPAQGQAQQLFTGQTLTGETAPRGRSIPRNTGDKTPANPSDSTPTDTPGETNTQDDDGQSELERRLRERRQRGE